MQIFWDKNLEALKKKDWKLHKKIVNYAPKNVGDIIPTETVPTLRFNHPGKNHTYAHNPCDPINEIQENMGLLKTETRLNMTVCIFIGMGLGYGPLIAFEQRKDIFKLIILEPSLDLFCMALKYIDLHSLIKSDKVLILAGEIDWDAFDTNINQKSIKTDFNFSDALPLFDWEPELYNNVKNKARPYVIRAISSIGGIAQFGEQWFKNRISNLTLFRESSSVDVLKGAFKGKPAIIVSAGPSLGKSMKLLKRTVGRCVLIAVDSAVAPLLQNGITPDIVTTLDFRNLNSEKLSPDIIQPADFSLVAAIYSSTLSAKRLPVKNLFFSFQENDTQDWILSALKVKHKMPPIGSVALLSLGFAQMIEADPIVMVGYDFALTSTETDHVKGAVFSYNWNAKGTITVPGTDGKPVKTRGFLLEFKQNFEQLLRQLPGNYINATASGAHIEGTRVQELSTVIEQYMVEKMSTENIISELLQSVDHSNVIKFISAAKKELIIARKRLSQVQKIINFNSKIVIFFKNEKTKSIDLQHFSQFPLKVQAWKQKTQKLLERFKPFMAVEEIAAEKIFEAKKIQELDLAESYIEQMAKESRIIGLEMQGHRQGLEIFIKSVGDLII
ncbi:MAG: DUF115 domain-containing protein, partial [Desulfobacula sp.]|nr:DUF115 domain-containing protein [Desulfobacula sp.]